MSEKYASPWFLQQLDRQIEADRVAWEKERKQTKRCLTIVWWCYGFLVAAYVGFYFIYIPIHEASHG